MAQAVFILSVLLVFGSLCYGEMEDKKNTSTVLPSSETLPSSFDPSPMTSHIESTSQKTQVHSSSQIETTSSSISTMVLIPTSTMSAIMSTSHAEPSSMIKPTSTSIEPTISSSKSSSTEFSPTPTIAPIMSSSSEHPSETVAPSASTSHVIPTTSVAPTTPKPHPTTKPSELDYKVFSNKTVCIEMTGEVNITVKYQLKNSTKMGTANFLLPKKGKASGTCATPGKDSTATLILTFTNMKFTWTFDVKKDNSWTSKSMMLMVTMKGNKLFPNAAQDNITVVSGNKSNVDTIKAQAAMSYSCSTLRKYMLGKDVTLNFESVQVQPFNEDKNKFSKADTCAAENIPNATNSIVPIAVGCALAGLIIIVLIAYCIGRRRAPRGYQNV